MYSDWCIFERERFREIYLAMVSKLIDYCLANRQYEAGIEYGKTILQADRVHERTHRKLMRLYYQAGDRVAAIRQFEDCRTALAEELSVEPSKLTQDLCQHIVRDTGPVKQLQPEQILRSLQRIRRLIETQTTIDQRLPQEIQKLEEALYERE
jgi:DNA-binding SARP family transcriptional activator